MAQTVFGGRAAFVVAAEGYDRLMGRYIWYCAERAVSTAPGTRQSHQ